MTLEELKQSLQEQITQAEETAAKAQVLLRQAEIDLAFLRGQLHGLNQIRIEQPIYSNGIEETPA